MKSYQSSQAQSSQGQSSQDVSYNRDYYDQVILNDDDFFSEEETGHGDGLINVTCCNGHVKQTVLKLAREKCGICSIIRRSDHKYTPMKNNYHYKDNEFLLMCNQGHKFITTFKTPTVICKLSNIIKLNGKKISIDLDSTYKNPDSYIHFHCDEMRHDPHCSYYGCVALKATEVE
jgi:hypothetical protein